MRDGHHLTAYNNVLLSSVRYVALLIQVAFRQLNTILIICTVLGGLAALDQFASRFFRSYSSVWSQIKTIVKCTNQYLSQIRSKYTSDEIEGIAWEWDLKEGEFKELTPLCPECTFELDLQPEQTGYHPLVGYRGNAPPKPRYTDVICNKCGFSERRDFPPQKFLRHIEREIRRRMRIGADTKAT